MHEGIAQRKGCSPVWLRSCLSLVDKPHKRIRRRYIVACNGDKKLAAHGALQSSNTGQRRRTETTKQRSKNSPLSSATDLLRLPLHDPVVRTNRNTHTNDIHFVNDSAVASSRGSRLERQSRVAQNPGRPPFAAASQRQSSARPYTQPCSRVTPTPATTYESDT